MHRCMLLVQCILFYVHGASFLDMIASIVLSLVDPDLCRNATEYTNNKDAIEITLHFINQRTETCLHIEWK